MSDPSLEERLDQILDVLTGFLRGEFKSDLPIDDPTSVMDGIHLAINLTGEELEHQRLRDEENRRELLENEALFRAIGDSAQDAIILIDNAGYIIFWNDAAERVFGWNREEAMGMDLHQLIVPSRFHPDQQKGFEQFQSSGEGNAIGQTLELSGIRNDGIEIPIELSLASVMINSEWHAVGIVRDISDRKEWETNLETARQELADRVKALEAALEHVKTLQGILPICMFCHNIRNDEETWERIDHYLSENTSVQLTHGLCPDCKSKHYPEIEKD